MIRKLPKKAKQTGRFISPRHRNHVRGHACVVCDASAPIVFAHVRNGSDAGMGRKPSDYYGVALCQPCHDTQHTKGEDTFWQGRNVEALMAEFVRTSPVRREIEAHRNA